MQGKLTQNELIAALNRGDLSQEFWFSYREGLHDINNRVLLPTNLAVLSFAGNSLTDALAAQFPVNRIQGINAIAERTEWWASQHGADLVTSIDNNTRLAIRSMIQRSVHPGLRNPIEVARTVRESVGLLPRHAEAVRKVYKLHYNALVESGVPSHKAGSIAGKAARKKARRLLKYRSELIARTEIHTALQEGQLRGMKYYRDTGLFPDKTVQKVWYTALDERVCSICGPMHETTLPLDGAFELTKGGTTEAVHAHPQCRCDAIFELA